jgi:hypothetical protein
VHRQHQRRMLNLWQSPDWLVHLGRKQQSRKDPGGLIPRKFERKQRTTPGAASALAIAIAFVGELQAATLRIFFKAASQAPSTVGATVAPAPVRRPDRFRALAARKRRLGAVRIVPPG